MKCIYKPLLTAVLESLSTQFPQPETPNVLFLKYYRHLVAKTSCAPFYFIYQCYLSFQRHPSKICQFLVNVIYQDALEGIYYIWDKNPPRPQYGFKLNAKYIFSYN